MSYGLVCVTKLEAGPMCPCESGPGIPASLPFMDEHGYAFCECHRDSATRSGLMPFPCRAPAVTEGES